MMSLACVAIGGAIGALTRHFIQILVPSLASGFPLGILSANIIGCSLIGYLYPQLGHFSELTKTLLTSGFLGALTTFSSFTIDVVIFLHTEKTLLALTYLCLSIILCISFCYLGFIIGQAGPWSGKTH